MDSELTFLGGLFDGIPLKRESILRQVTSIHTSMTVEGTYVSVTCHCNYQTGVVNVVLDWKNRIGQPYRDRSMSFLRFEATHRVRKFIRQFGQRAVRISNGQR